MTFNELPFVSITGSEANQKTDPWSPAVTGDFDQDCATGRGYFENMRDCIKATENPTLLSRVLHAQMKKGTWGGVEIGFCHAMATCILAEP